jgi:hypothetical protein
MVKNPHGKIGDSLRKKIGAVGSKKREEEPADVFLVPSQRKYPVKVKSGSGWVYSRTLLVAAERRATMNGDQAIAGKARAILSRLPK